jgi:hypothetical protein
MILVTSVIVQVFGRRDDGLTTRSGGRRPKTCTTAEVICEHSITAATGPCFAGPARGVPQAAALSFSNAELFRRFRSRSPDAAC